MMMNKILFTAFLLLLVTPAHAWNALGHRVIADIAWRRLDPQAQQEIAATLRRHPHFDEDFAKQMPADVDENRWIFQQAAVWPDLIRGNREFDHPTWHCVNFPLFVGGELPLYAVNTSSDYPSTLAQSEWNVAQAVKICQETLSSELPLVYLSEGYLKHAGKLAQLRAAAAGKRLAAVWKAALQ